MTERKSHLVRQDIVEALEKVLNASMRPGTADSDVNVLALPVEVPYGLLDCAIKEIRKLRGDVVETREMAGFREIKQEINHGL